MRTQSLIAGLIVSFFAMSTSAEPSSPYWDLGSLSDQDRSQFERIRGTVNDFHSRNGLPDPLQDEITEFIGRDPNFLPMHIENARFAIMRGSLRGYDWKQANRDALKILERLMKSAPNYGKAWVLAGHAYTNLDELDEATRVLQKARGIKEAEPDPWLHSNWGELLRKKGKFEEANEAFERALARSDGNAKARTAAAQWLQFNAKDLDRSPFGPEMLQSVFENLDSAEERIALAVELDSRAERNGDQMRLALEILGRECGGPSEVADCPITFADMLLGRGVVRSVRRVGIYNENIAKAVEALLTPFRKAPLFSERIYPPLARVLMSRGDFGAAQELLKEGRQYGLSAGEWAELEASMLYASGDVQGTIDFVFEVGEIAPSVMFNGPIMSAVRDADDVELEGRYYELATRRLPDHATVHGNYANYLLLRGDAAGAIKAGEKALGISPYEMVRDATAAAYRLSAAEQRVAGNPQKAESLFRKAHEIWSVPTNNFRGPEYCFDLCAEIDALADEFNRSQPPASTSK